MIDQAERERTYRCNEIYDPLTDDMEDLGILYQDIYEDLFNEENKRLEEIYWEYLEGPLLMFMISDEGDYKALVNWISERAEKYAKDNAIVIYRKHVDEIIERQEKWLKDLG